MADIKNTQELVKLVVALAGVVKSSNENGKVDINDLGSFITVFPYVGAAVSGITEIPAELSDLDETEVALLASSVAEVIGDLSGDEKYKKVAESAVRAASEIYGIVELLK